MRTFTACLRRGGWLVLLLGLSLLATQSWAQLTKVPLRGPPLGNRPPNSTLTINFLDLTTGKVTPIAFGIPQRVPLLPRQPDIGPLNNGSLNDSGEFVWSIPPTVSSGGGGGGGIGGGIGGAGGVGGIGGIGGGLGGAGGGLGGGLGGIGGGLGGVGGGLGGVGGGLGGIGGGGLGGIGGGFGGFGAFPHMGFTGFGGGFGGATGALGGGGF